MRARATAERGAALLSAMVSIAVLTAMAVNLAYESRVALRIAANARDELRASYLARSGVTMSRLVLDFQRELNDVQPPAPGVAIPKLNLWRLLPVDSDLAGALFPSVRLGGDAAPRSGFSVDIDDETLKVNAQLDMNVGASAGPSASARVQALYQVICDPRWDPLFEREDANGVRTSREELLVRLRDWVDEDEQGAGLRAAASAASCSLVVDPLGPFEPGYGDENQPYDRGEDRYRTKNHRLDSLDELFLVSGIGDAFMAAFGEALTVYLPRDGAGARRNSNVPCEKLVEIALLMAESPAHPAAHDPVFAQNLCALVSERTAKGLLSIPPDELGRILLSLGMQVNLTLLSPTNPNNPFTDRSTTFRVRSTGRAGDVETTIDAVVRTEKPQPGAPVAAPGRLVHWKEG